VHTDTGERAITRAAGLTVKDGLVPEAVHGLFEA
jgi:hypothetical protein